MGWAKAWVWSAVLLAVASCGGGDGGRGGGGGEDGGGDGGGDSTVVIPGEGCVTNLPVDILWVVDNSHSMREEQESLAINFPALIEVLTNPPDLDGDGSPDHPPVDDLRMAVITTDLGTTASDDWFGDCTAEGDRGAFVTSHRSNDPRCAGYTAVPPFLSFSVGDDASQITSDFACLAKVGTEGCGLEQQLEAALLAVTDRARAGELNSDFMRPDSLLAIVFVTDEDDCSAVDKGLYGMTRTDLGEIGLRCGSHPELLHPIERYVTGFKGLRLDRRGDVVVAAITGVPRELTQDPQNINYDAVLADPRMQFRPGDDDATQPQPACAFGGVGSAAPARRIVETIKVFAEDGKGVVQSICNSDLRPAITAIATLISGKVCPPPI